jgi:PleD family two-component response regulator
MTISERLRLQIAEGHGRWAHGRGATISGGLSEMTAGDTSYEDVLKRADDALYRAKRDGRNRIIATARRGAALASKPARR